jgi:cell division transport system ATP-binding protein
MTETESNAFPLIALHGVKLAREEHIVMQEVDLTVQRGEFVYLLGATGSGKSSLLKALYGELALTAGRGEVCGFELALVHSKNVHELRRQLGIVFQDFALLPDRTVNANLEFVLKSTGWKDSAARQKRMDDCLRAVGLSEKGYKMPHELSGGEQQRVAIARALLNDPPLILADEPTGNLDPKTTEGILKLLHDLAQSNRSVLMATHDHGAPRRFAGRILRCEGGRLHEDFMG